MHEQIVNLGWSWHGYCNCTIRGKVYRKGNYRLIHNWEQQRFTLKLKSRLILNGTDDILIEKIKEY